MMLAVITTPKMLEISSLLLKLKFSFNKINTLNETVHHSVNSTSKRLIDIVGGLVGLGITLILLIPIAIAMQFDSPGPIFYCQTRCGVNGKPFRIWKFRSMVVNADKQKHLVKNEAKGYIFKNENDPRITRVGKILRKTSLDEFPQFWNVLTGDMSLVGTRPPTPDEVEQYAPHHFARLRVKPGITGEWQVKGRSNVKDFEEIVKMDLAYQQQWTPLYDLSLIMKTIRVVLARKGAY
ncbi:MAG: sugar transferase [Gomphosphaeria aponina SAG 52.96 = DSM 107014]|uniref:Sugar transferase n=1 Tax=Gomphosphaeria aponina SAG 52.96 = DSM 107014 TaxID=1521640 RepID=A0A941GMI2_9CHRO|nr:sugar transferase [Gomphosphaeria aponina SAG 52.96 = DSM 107014]